MIRTNLSALTAQGKLQLSRNHLTTALERLSSGLRVNSARDDAAGQAIGNRLQAQVTGQTQAARNASDGISLVQTAEGALGQINERLQRIRELSVQGLSGTLSLADKDVIQGEINLNLKEIDRINQQSRYNGIPLLSGEAGELSLQVGAFDQQVLPVDLRPPGFSTVELGLRDFSIAGLSGTLRDINTLPGDAFNIQLQDASTTVTYHWQNSSSTLPAGSKLMRQGTAGSFFVQTTDGNGQPAHYLASVDAHSTTATRSSTVDIATSPGVFYVETQDLEGNTPLSSLYIRYAAQDNSTISSLNQPRMALGNEDGHYYMRTLEGGETFYYRASIRTDDRSAISSSTLNQTLVQVTDSQRLTTVDFDESITQTTALPLAGRTTYLAGNGGSFTTASGPELVTANGNYYIRASSAGETLYYAATVTTNFVSGQISVRATDDKALTTRTFTEPATGLKAHDLQSLLDENGLPLGAGAKLTSSDGQFFISDELAGETVHYAATVVYRDESGTIIDPDTYAGTDQITAEARISQTRPLYAQSAFIDGDVQVESMSPAIDVNAAGLPADTRIVSGSDGRYYLKHDDGGGLVSYSTLQSLTSQDSVSVTNVVQGVSRMRADFDTATLLSKTPDVTLGAADTLTNDQIPGSELVVDQGGLYYLRSLDADSASFHYAKVTTILQSDGSFTVELTPTSMVAARTLADVEAVTGTSTVSLDPLDPPNVTVRYVEATGVNHKDVLGRDEYGNYILNLPNSSMSNGKTATLVKLEEIEGAYISGDGMYLLKTRNNNGDIVLYYAMEFSAATNAGNDYTQVVVSEIGDAIRLRLPKDPLAALDRAMAQIDSKRSLLGATQNRLESLVERNTLGSINLSAARSRIMDADYAREVASMTRAQILQQAGTSVLAQANQIPQGVLSLLK